MIAVRLGSAVVSVRSPDGQLWALRFTPTTANQVLRTAIRWAQSRQLTFSWKDLALLNARLGLALDHMQRLEQAAARSGQETTLPE